MKKLVSIFVMVFLIASCSKDSSDIRPNILFVLMDDLGYGQFGIYNDTIVTSDFNPYFVKLVDSLQGYSLTKSLEFSKKAIPTLTSLAKQGVIYNRAFTSSNICAPSRMGIATGINQNKFGIYTNDDCEKGGLQKGLHLSEILQDQDYFTAHIGKWHIGRRDKKLLDSVYRKYDIEPAINYYLLKNRYPEAYNDIIKSGYIGSVTKEQHPLNNGFDYYYGYNHWACSFYNAKNVWENFEHIDNQQGYNTDVFTDKAINAMESSFAEKKPFYVQLHYHAVHDSLEPKAPDKYFMKFDSGSYDLDNFYAHVNAVDDNIKRVIEFLKSKKQYENTMIIFTSDNGAMAGGSYDGYKTGSPLPGNTPFSGHKGNFYQGGFRVPMFISWPNGIKSPKMYDKMVSAMDILPTAIDAIGGQVPENIDGKSLLSTFDFNMDKSIHDHSVWSGLHSYKWGYLITKSAKTHGNESGFAPPSWVVVKGDYLLRYIGTLEENVYLDFMQGREPVIELFNIKTDPAEMHDLAKEKPELVKELTDLYLNQAKQYKEPVDWKISKWKELKRQDYKSI